MKIVQSQLETELIVSEKERALAKIVGDTMPLFRKANNVLLIILGIALAVDIIYLWSGYIEADQRIISSTVIVTLIGATAAEISVIILAAIAKFPH
ncbi:hypothetical protein [Hoeflea poritis]|uniref:Uncharacterized protein n=1 Tax=Hoeflea poritis TaxID=2993659 RepID=A0ABT4VQP4_9HYPH|nr:hypothetical protein [Hoeflea poritis]MDA4846412.1 hypothetical protein [Hoeflea poritis]